MKRFKHIFLYCLILLSFLISCDHPVSNDSIKTIALINGVLIDGTGSGPIHNATVLIRDGKITRVGSRPDSFIPYGTEIIDLRGQYILPGFMNTHVHNAYDENNLKQWALNGVTTVRDLGAFRHSPEQAFSLRNGFLKDNVNARLVSAGPIVTTVGGYGNYFVASPEDAENKINALIDSGADLIKIAIEDNLQGRTWPMLSQEEIDRIVQTSHKRGKKVSAHISRSHHLEMAIKAGVDDVNHMIVNDLSDSLIHRMIEKNIYWIPTLELWFGVGQLYGSNWYTIPKNNLHRFVTAGGKVALGTDFGGYTTHFDLGMPATEIGCMKEAGMTPLQIIIAATKHAAYACDLENKLGTIESGKIADIIILNGNPLDDLESLLNVRMVIHNGEIIKTFVE